MLIRPGNHGSGSDCLVHVVQQLVRPQHRMRPPRGAIHIHPIRRLLLEQLFLMPVQRDLVEIAVGGLGI